MERLPKMSITQFFPIDFVKKNTTVVLYGAGDIGKKYYEQNKKIEWCNIICAVDMNHQNIIDFPIPVLHPREINNLSYDVVVVSINSLKYKQQAIDTLKKLGVAPEKIVNEINAYFYRDSAEEIIIMDGLGENSSTIKIGFWVSRALGDQVVSLKLYQEIVRIAPASSIDVFCGNSNVAENVFYQQKNLCSIIHAFPSRNLMMNYDLVIRVEFSTVICAYRPQKIGLVSAELMACVERSIHYQRMYSPDNSELEYNSRIMIDRGLMLGLNRYELLGNQGAFVIKGTDVRIYINEMYKDDFSSLRPSNTYITLNYGAGNATSDNTPQTKIWPYEYYEDLVRLLKEKFPLLNIVQIGDINARKIKGVDSHILGKSLEVIKFLLKNAFFHFDCESGLPHLATQLGTKCFVVFGVSMPEIFGYKSNVNIKSDVCGGCVSLSKNWYIKCLRYNRPECMYSIKPSKVFSLMESYIEDNEIIWKKHGGGGKYDYHRDNNV